MGLEFSLNRNALTESTKEELFPSVLALLKEGKNSKKATAILFLLDNEKAKDYFLSDASFNAGSDTLPSVLATMANANVPVSWDRLLSLIKSLESQKANDSSADSLDGALRLLGQQMNVDDREFLRSRLSNSQEVVATGAADGLICSYGLQGFEEKLWKKEDQVGYRALSQDQKYYCAVIECNEEINNGGLVQYFVNSSGDDWPDALAGFEVMGMKKRLEILKKATALFGSEGPSTNRKIRQDQLAKLYRANDSAFDALDSLYYKTPKIFDVLTRRYVLEHPDSFR